MIGKKPKITGVWLPIVTPFLDGEVDYESYEKLVRHYISKGISGIIPAGTTGESPALSDYEYEKIMEKTIEAVDGKIPIYMGLGGNYTKKVVDHIKTVEKYKIDGILSVCPYYNRPDQRGIEEHFKKISGATDLSIIIYNIPYRTGRNIENATIRRLAGLANIAGLKDSCGDIRQTMELLMNPPPDFSILTGEDILYYITLTMGGDGGILAAAHLYTEDYIDIFNSLQENNHQKALGVWKKLSQIIPLLFIEPNPAPVKYCLRKLGLIASDEARLPLMSITETLRKELDNFL